MLGSLLIANRGEIARRIIRTARRLGVRTIAVYSDADASAPFVREADTAVHIGSAAARDSYLRGETILAAAKATGAATPALDIGAVVAATVVPLSVVAVTEKV